MTETPIEDYLDELLRRTRADARTTRRLLDEVGDHLYTAAEELRREGFPQREADLEAVRRFGPVTPVAHATFRRSFLALAIETLRAALFLGSCGLIAVGLSGLVALVMNVSFGRDFVGEHTRLGGVGPGPSVAETADDAVVLRVLAGLVGLILLLGYRAWRRRGYPPSLLPRGFVDALGAAAFTAAAVALTGMSVDQAAQAGAAGVGFALSGALVALPAGVYFCVRAARELLPARTAHPDPSA